MSIQECQRLTRLLRSQSQADNFYFPSIIFISPPETEHGVLEGLFGLEQFWHSTGCGISWVEGTSGVSVPPSCPRQGQLQQPLKTFPLVATNTSTMGKKIFSGIFLRLLPSIYLSLTSMKYLKIWVQDQPSHCQ